MRARRAATIEASFRRALSTLDPHERVHAALAAAPARGLEARVIAIGKAAPAMAAGAIARWGKKVERCLVVAPRGVDTSELLVVAEAAGIGPRLTVLTAGHPLPDRGSVRAADACLAMASSSAADRRAVLVLISGGASALVCKPTEGVSLEAKRALTETMLRSGAPIQAMNVVRKHLSRIKGGGLARAAFPSPIHTLVVSDVLDGEVADIGSGPSVGDPSTVGDARRFVKQYASSHEGIDLTGTLALSDRRARAATAEILVSPDDLAEALAKELRHRVDAVRVLPRSQDDVEKLARDYVRLATSSRSARACAFVRVAEPAVPILGGGGRQPRAGKGGRSTHLAALVGRELAGTEATFAAIASDGVDGRSGTGGAIVDGRFAAVVAKTLGAGALDTAIARFATGPLHASVNTALPGRATGHNLADVHVLVVAPRAKRR